CHVKHLGLSCRRTAGLLCGSAAGCHPEALVLREGSPAMLKDVIAAGLALWPKSSSMDRDRRNKLPATAEPYLSKQILRWLYANCSIPQRGHIVKICRADGAAD